MSPSTSSEPSPRRAIAVVIPAYRASGQIGAVLAAIGPEVDRIYVVDDGCPDGIGRAVEGSCGDPRVRVLHHDRNLGVGAATMTGYRQAIADGAEVIVKLDADGQMDPLLIPRLARLILDGAADYCKGNRFYRLEDLRGMPAGRLLGNACLSFLTKAATGYWDVFDPTNGFTAVHAGVAGQLPLDKISRRYFFESDLLFRLNILRASVADVPMPARYGSEHSQLSPWRAIGEFSYRNAVNLGKRIVYNYFLRDFNIASIELVAGLGLLLFGLAFGLRHWALSAATGQVATTGTVMLAALPVILGAQLLIGFLAFDIQNVPRAPLHRRL